MPSSWPVSRDASRSASSTASAQRARPATATGISSSASACQITAASSPVTPAHLAKCRWWAGPCQWRKRRASSTRAASSSMATSAGSAGTATIELASHRMWTFPEADSIRIINGWGQAGDRRGQVAGRHRSAVEGVDGEVGGRMERGPRPGIAGSRLARCLGAGTTATSKRGRPRRCRRRRPCRRSQCCRRRRSAPRRGCGRDRGCGVGRRRRG